NLPALAEPGQQRGVFARRDPDAVARRVDDALGLNIGSGERWDVWQAGAANRGSERSNKTAAA
ncbi:MAG: hypothetical protein RLZZ53_212, partial [Acidobacteriota bacterium]